MGSCLPWHLWVLCKGIWRSDPVSGQIQVSQLSGNQQSAKTSKPLGRKLGNLFRLKKQLNVAISHTSWLSALTIVLHRSSLQIKALLQNRILLLLLKGIVWVGKDLKNPLLSTPLPWSGTPSTRPGCSGPHPAWPWSHLVLAWMLTAHRTT